MSQVDSHARLDAARDYLRRGWAPLPIQLGQKGPRIPGWTSFRTSEEDLSKHFSDDGNIGIILGSASSQVVDVDLDAPETLKLADYFLPKTGVIFGRVSKPESHMFYVAENSREIRHRAVSRNFAVLDSLYGADQGRIQQRTLEALMTSLPFFISPSMPTGLLGSRRES